MFQTVDAVRRGEVTTCAVRSTARAGLETGGPSRRAASAGELRAEVGAAIAE